MTHEKERMPIDLVLLRHGESEANIAQRLQKAGRDNEAPEALLQRHDWEHRLTEKGVGQAALAGAWIAQNICPVNAFDLRYASKFIRTRETAANLGGVSCEWLLDDRLKERDWGIYGTTPYDKRRERYEATEQLRSQNSWYTRLDGGEALADNVLARVRDWFATLHRDASEKRVLAVTHGEFMWTVRGLVEQMLPEEWHDIEKDKTQRLANCAILWYSRANPEDPSDVAPYIKWRRMIYPDDITRSPFGGEWCELPGKRRFTTLQLQESVDEVPRLLST